MTTFPATFTNTLAPLYLDNIDTDQIIPARFLTATDRNSFAKHLFADWRYDTTGTPQPDFVLNQPQYQSAQILLAHDNFGCGSSREHAPWALRSYGFQVIIATSFADIFNNNALKNNLLPITLPEADVAELYRLSQQDPTTIVTVNLEQQTVSWGKHTTSFHVNPFNKIRLLQGVDDIGYTLQFIPDIERYEQTHCRITR